MTRVPSHVAILGEVYKVELVVGFAAQNPSDAEVDFETNTIRIDAELARDPRKFLRTFFHELCHIWLCEIGACEYLNGQAEEMFCQSLGAMLMQVFKMQFHDHLLQDD